MSAHRLTLTFDNGPTPGVTERVLDVLAGHEVRTTFFTVGADLARPGRRPLLERARAAGHWIGNHTTTHSIQFGADHAADLPGREIEANQLLIGALEHPDRPFRPWGRGGILDEKLLSPDAVAHLERGGYSCVLWNSVPHDWEDATGWVDRARANIAEREWTLMVIHDIASGAMDRLDDFLGLVERDGVELRQDYPDDCVPIRRGIRTGTLAGLIS